MFLSFLSTSVCHGQAPDRSAFGLNVDGKRGYRGIQFKDRSGRFLRGAAGDGDLAGIGDAHHQFAFGLASQVKSDVGGSSGPKST